ncbi:MAG: hypothetical protein RUMPE_00307 [Eubacteriales bacterium SKADARSKE-1]|nr:hypothetical protein [Eubacteriales bacterium SKADARSKE-1]
MKKLKRIIGCILSTVFVVCTAACTNNDKTWALKYENNTLPNGVYIYFLFDAYNNAIEKLSQDGATIENIETQTIEEQKAADWIQDNAIDACKNMLVVEKLFDDAKLSLTEDSTKSITEESDSFWEYSHERMEKYGISKDDFKRAYPTNTAKMKQLFDSIYGKGGSKAVSDEELLNYYKTTYVKINLFSKISNESLNDDETAQENKPAQTDEQIEEQFKSYVDMLNNGGKSVQEISNMFKVSENLETDPLETEVMNPNDSDISDEIKNTISTLEVGKATYTKLNDAFIFIYKNDINTEPLNLADDETRKKTLQDMKFGEFEEMIEGKKSSMKIEVNESSIKDYPPTETFKES